ncbi:MAG: hypothetical protein Q9224_002115 [Gallowayella concinna]
MGGPQPLWLLILPSPPPQGITRSSIRSLYASTISQVLIKAAVISSSFSTTTILDIAIPYAGSSGLEPFQYSDLQNLLGTVYSLICMLCAENSIDVQFGNDVDVRVLLFKTTNNGVVEDDSSVGSIVNLRRLACCGRPWQRVCSMDDENSEIILQIFLKLHNEALDSSNENIVVERFVSETSFSGLANTTLPAADDGAPRRHHNAVAVGGTFDHLHVGHKLLLSMTALVLDSYVPEETRKGRTLTIGITGDKLLQNKQFSEQLQGWDQRQAAVETFLLAFLVVNAPLQRFTSTEKEESEGKRPRTVLNNLPSELAIEYVEIFDAFGPTITNEAISALVLSGETRAGGTSVNEKRAEKNWPALDIFEVDVLDSATTDAARSNQASHGFQDKLSSTEIRRRLAKRSGTAN